MITLLLPAYNEAANLKAMFEFLVKHPVVDKVLLVDDGSTDETVSLVEGFCRSLVKPGVEIVRHEKNQGLGAALRTGIIHLVNNKLLADDIVVTMDSDNTHPLDLIPLMCEKIKERSDIVIASRFYPGGKEVGVPFSRRLLSRGLRLVIRVMSPLKEITDYSCGYRAFKGSLLQKLYRNYGENVIEETGFAGTLELLLKLAPLAYRITEVPLILRYDRKKGQSKLRVVPTIIKELSLLLKFNKIKKSESKELDSR